MPPFGSITPMFSTNPFSYGVPAAEEDPIVFDVATTTVAGNKILLAKKRGDATIPANWANDDQGRPTTDTVAASVLHLQWFGGHKGYGMAILVELLAGVLASSSFGRTEVTASEAARQRPDRQGLPVRRPRSGPLPARAPTSPPPLTSSSETSTARSRPKASNGSMFPARSSRPATTAAWPRAWPSRDGVFNELNAVAELVGAPALEGETH